MRTINEILNDLRTKPSATVPDTGKILAGKSANASYEAARNKTLGVDVFWSGGQLRTASIDVLRKLGLEHEAKFTEARQQADAASAIDEAVVHMAAGPASTSTTRKPAPANARKSPASKATARKTPAREASTQRQDRRRSRQPETVA
jgi:hypothetical protein